MYIFHLILLPIIIIINIVIIIINCISSHGSSRGRGNTFQKLLVIFIAILTC